MLVGECFWGTEKTAAEEKVQQLTSEAQEQKQQIQQQIDDNQAALGDLRTKLYAKLGDSINLDEPYKASN